MFNYLTLKELSYRAAQDTSQGDFIDEVEERKKDLKFVVEPHNALLVGATPSEIVAWRELFGDDFDAISLQQFPEITVMDMHELRYKEDSFDYIYASNVLEHSPAPILALMELHRVLKRNGHAFFWMPTDLTNQMERYHYSCFPPEIWLSLMEKAGFVVEKHQRINNQVYYLCVCVK